MPPYSRVYRPPARRAQIRRQRGFLPLTRPETLLASSSSPPNGLSGAFILDPSYVVPTGLSGPLRVLSWKTARYTNRVGSFTCTVAIDDQAIEGSPVHTQIKSGWHISIVQEGTDPSAAPEDYLLYNGVIKQRSYGIAEASATLTLTGFFRALHLTDRTTLKGLTYTGQAFSTAIDALVSTLLGTNGSALYPTVLTTMTLTATFNDISRFSALLKLGELCRMTLRESWDHDRPEFVHVDSPPFSGYTLVNLEAFDESMDEAADAGFAVIGGTPVVRYEGQSIVNRITAIGSDTPEGDLKLNSASTTTPYTVQTGTNPDSSSYYYIEDTDSQSRYGLIETRLNRTDVKNPSDNAGTRQAAANVLYAIAAGELLRKKAEVIEVTLPIVNGADVYAIPGDSIRLRYTGKAIDADGEDVIWMDEDRLFLVTERHDTSDLSGIRQVELVLAAPEVTITVPGLPNAIVLPAPPGGGTFPFPPPPGDQDSPVPGCCDDQTTDINNTVPGQIIYLPGPEIEAPPDVDDPPPAVPEAVIMVNQPSGMAYISGGDYEFFIHYEASDLAEGDVVIVVVDSDESGIGDGNPDIPTLTFPGLTFTQRTTVAYDTVYRQTVFTTTIPPGFDFVANAGDSGSPGTASWGEEQGFAPSWVTIRVRSVAETPVQAVTDHGDVGEATASVALAAVGDPYNIVIAILGFYSDTYSAYTWTTIDEEVAVQNGLYVYEYNPAADPSWTMVPNQRWAVAALEMEAL